MMHIDAASVGYYLKTRRGVWRAALHFMSTVLAAALSLDIRTQRRMAQENFGNHGWRLAQIGTILQKNHFNGIL